jgi:hypothetical protein
MSMLASRGGMEEIEIIAREIIPRLKAASN